MLLGSFNPSIFQPAWLCAKGVEPESPEESVQAMMLPGVSQFLMHDRTYFINHERFSVESQAAPWVRMVDIVHRIFGEHLVHTPVRAFGVNRAVHFRLPTQAAAEKLLRAMAPLEPWEGFGEQLNAKVAGLTGGLQSLTMRAYGTVEGAMTSTNVTVEPSGRLGDASGIYVAVNAHHDLTDLPASHGAQPAIDFLSKRFEQLVQQAEALIDGIMKAGSKR